MMRQYILRISLLTRCLIHNQYYIHIIYSDTILFIYLFIYLFIFCGSNLLDLGGGVVSRLLLV